MECWHHKQYHFLPALLIRPSKPSQTSYPPILYDKPQAVDNTPLLPSLIQLSIYFQRYDRYLSNQLLCSLKKKKINFPVWGKDTSPTFHSTLTQLYFTCMGFSTAKIPMYYQFIFCFSAHFIYKCQKTTQASFSKYSGFIHFYKWKEEQRDLASGPSDGLPPATLLLSVSFSTYHLCVGLLSSALASCSGGLSCWRRMKTLHCT